MNQSPKISIPQFNSIAEEAAFWDVHDTAEFKNEFEEIEVEFEMPLLKHGLVIMLDEPYLSQLYAYDAYFLHCAKTLSCPILTLDRRMREVAIDIGLGLLE